MRGRTRSKFKSELRLATTSITRTALLNVKSEPPRRERLLTVPRPIVRFFLFLAATTFAIAAAPSSRFFASSNNSIQAQNPQNPPEHTLKIDAKLVPIRVVVRDSSGRAVGSLTKDDFQIFDNGKPQVISQFFTEQTAGGPGAAPGNAATPESQAPTSATKPASKIFTLYLIDDL